MKWKDFPHSENLLDNPAVVFLQRLFVGFDDVNPNEVGVVLVPLSVCQTLQEDLYETETSAGESEYKQTEFSLSASVQQAESSNNTGSAHLFSHIRANVAPTLGHCAAWASLSASTMSCKVTYFSGSLRYTALIFWR